MNFPVDCEVKAGSWSACSVVVRGKCSRRRELEIVRRPEHGGATCPALQTEECDYLECRQDCKVEPVGEWSDCSATCGLGTMTRKWVIVQTCERGGAPCTDLDNQEILEITHQERPGDEITQKKSCGELFCK